MNVWNSIEAILTRTVNYVALSFPNFPFYQDSMCRWWKGFYLSKLEYNANSKHVYGICRLHLSNDVLWVVRHVKVTRN